MITLSGPLQHTPTSYVDLALIPNLSIYSTSKIVPGSNNTVAIDLICTHIRRKFQERTNQFRQKMAIPHRYLTTRSGASTPESRLEDLDLNVLPQTPQLQVSTQVLRDLCVLTLSQRVYSPS